MGIGDSCPATRASLPAHTRQKGPVVRGGEGTSAWGGCRGAVSPGHTAAVTTGCHSRGGEGSIPLVLRVEKYQLGDLNDSTEATEESAL